MSSKNMDIIEFTEKVLGIKLWDIQKQILKETIKNNGILPYSSMRMGKVTLRNILKKFKAKKLLM